MGLAKYAEQLRNKAFRAFDPGEETTHSSILNSRRLPGREPNKPDPVGAAIKQAKARERIRDKQRKREEQRLAAKKAEEDKVTLKARELIADLAPMIIKQNDRLLKHVKMLQGVIDKQKLQIADLRHRLSDD